MKYTVEIAGISHKNKDGEPRRDIVIDNLSNDYSGVVTSLKRHSGNRNDKNAIGVYIEKPGLFGFDPVMIGFIPREIAKDVSPMIKRGCLIQNIKITRVWIPDYSDVATPCVTISFDGQWTHQDIISSKKEISEARKLARQKKMEENKTQRADAASKNTIITAIKSLLSFIFASQKK